MIHTFLILKRSGENIYKKSLGNINMDETIMSGLFSAFFTFTQKLCGSDIQDIELGQYRMLFEIVEKDLILAVISDKSDSIINIQQKLLDIKNIIRLTYGDKIKEAICNTDDFEGLNEIVDNVISKQQSNFIDDDLKSQYLKILHDLRSNEEISDCTLISVNGINLGIENKKEFVDLSIKQMDAFWKFKTKVLDQIILYYENKYVILIKINNKLVLSVLTKPNTPIGLVTFIIDEYATKISKIDMQKNVFSKN